MKHLIPGLILSIIFGLLGFALVEGGKGQPWKKILGFVLIGLGILRLIGLFSLH